MHYLIKLQSLTASDMHYSSDITVTYRGTVVHKDTLRWSKECTHIFEYLDLWPIVASKSSIYYLEYLVRGFEARL